MVTSFFHLNVVRSWCLHRATLFVSDIPTLMLYATFDLILFLAGSGLVLCEGLHRSDAGTSSEGTWGCLFCRLIRRHPSTTGWSKTWRIAALLHRLYALDFGHMCLQVALDTRRERHGRAGAAVA